MVRTLLGALAFAVSTGTADAGCAGDDGALPRRVLILHEGGSQAADRIAPFSAALRRMGLVPDPRPVEDAIREPAEAAGLVGLFLRLPIPEGPSRALADWMDRLDASCDGALYRVALGDPAKASGALLRGLGLSYRGERMLYPGHPAPEAGDDLPDTLPSARPRPGIYPVLEPRPGAEALLTIADAQGLRSALAVRWDRGLYVHEALTEWAARNAAAIFHGFRPRDVAPVADMASVQGRRLAALVVDPVGWTERAPVSGSGAIGDIGHDILGRILTAHPARLPVTLARIDARMALSETGPAADAAQRAFDEASAAPQVTVHPARHPDGDALSVQSEPPLLRLPVLRAPAAMRAAGPLRTDRDELTLPAISGPPGWSDPTGLHGIGPRLEATADPADRLPAMVVVTVRDLLTFAGRQAVLSLFDRFAGDEYAPRHLSEVSGIAAGFDAARLLPEGPLAWRVTEAGGLPSLRFDHAEGMAVDMNTSSGVLGVRRVDGALLVSLDPATSAPRVALARVPDERATTNAAGRPVLRHAGPRLSGLAVEGCALSVRVSNSADGTAVWHVSPGSTLVYSVDETRGSATADAAGHVTIALPETYGRNAVLTLEPDEC
ncbi:MAG: hypothetical protein ACU0DK_04305 [Pseudooceanicola sp.]